MALRSSHALKAGSAASRLSCSAVVRSRWAAYSAAETRRAAMAGGGGVVAQRTGACKLDWGDTKPNTQAGTAGGANRRAQFKPAAQTGSAGVLWGGWLVAEESLCRMAHAAAARMRRAPPPAVPAAPRPHPPAFKDQDAIHLQIGSLNRLLIAAEQPGGRGGVPRPARAAHCGGTHAALPRPG